MIEITDEFMRKVIRESIEFGEKLKDPQFIEEIEKEKERMRKLDLREFFHNDSEDVN